MSGKLLQFEDERLDSISEEEFQERLGRLRMKMLIDAEGVWRSLVGLAKYGLDEQTQLAAQKVALAYTLGIPVQRTEVTQKGGNGGPSPLPPLEALSNDELQALNVIRNAQRRRALASGDDDK